ncbi:response regulator transcription factor [Streptomyces sp. NPDC001178]
MAGKAGRVLVVDDDAAIRRSLERGLRLSGFSVAVADGGRRGLAEARAERPDIIVLDICMPGFHGIDVCRALRGDGDDVAVLMLSALDEEADRVAGLQVGGDDYLVKPFALQELVLRLHALLHRRPPAATGHLRVGGLVLDRSARQASLDDRPLELTPREFALLEALARDVNIVLTREQLLDLVWGYDFQVRGDAVDTFVSHLRRKLEEGGRPRILHAVPGIGFVLRTDGEVRKAGDRKAGDRAVEGAS